MSSRAVIWNVPDESRKVPSVQVSPKKGRGATCPQSLSFPWAPQPLKHSHTHCGYPRQPLKLLCGGLRFITKTTLFVTFPVLLKLSSTFLQKDPIFRFYLPPAAPVLSHGLSKSVTAVLFPETWRLWEMELCSSGQICFGVCVEHLGKFSHS